MTAPRQDDAVEYRLFPCIPDDLPQDQHFSFVEQQAEVYLAQLSDHLVDYIWQNEPFRLRTVAGTTGSPSHLYGVTSFGDNIEDEWFIVFLLKKLTQQNQGLVAKVWDNDGEFLLVEAADHLPRWLNPETAENRVYIYEGRVHIIPQPESPADVTVLPSGQPSLHQAVSCVRNFSQRTKASDGIQRDIRRRIRQFPEKAKENLHRTHVYVPAALAAVLDHSPQLVAPIVQAFYHRDPIDLKACVTMNYFRPGTRVMRCVTLTRCLYAQLMQQRFQPDKRSGFNVLATSNPNFKAYDLGTKLAYGAEILCSRCGAPSLNTARDINHNDVRWQRFKTALANKGYFRGEIEGSQTYQKLLEDAKSFYVSAISSSTCNGDLSPGERIQQVLQKVDVDIEVMRRQEQNLPSPDDDSWLEITPEQLDDMLKKAAGDAPGEKNYDMGQLRDSMKAFVDNVSSHEGAEFPGQGGGDEDGEVQFDTSSFIQNMQKMFEFDDPKDDSDSDLDEYGSEDDLDSIASLEKKPAKTSQQSPSKGSTPSPDVGEYLGLQQYMAVMDRELAGTTIGQSFEKEKSKPKDKKPVPPARPHRPTKPPKPVGTSTPSSLAANSRSAPNAGATPRSGPPRPAPPKARPSQPPPPKPKPKPSATRPPPPKADLDDDLDDIDDLDDDFKPVNVDMNLVKNLMASHQAQAGLAGPTSNIMGSMGVKGQKGSKKQPKLETTI